MQKALNRLFIRRGSVLTLMFTLLLVPSAQTITPTKPTRLNVGDPAISGLFIKPYTNAWRLTYQRATDPAPIEASIWRDKVETIEEHCRPLLKRTQDVKYSKADVVQQFVNIFDPRTMAPVSMDYKLTGTAVAGVSNHRTFDGLSVTYRRIEANETSPHEGIAKFDVPVFDFYGGMYGLLLAAAPLKQGYTAAIPSISEKDETLRWAEFTVKGKEMVDAGSSKKVEAWVVKTDDNGPMTFWLTKEPPYVIKLVYVDKQGTVFTYAMI